MNCYLVMETGENLADDGEPPIEWPVFVAATRAEAEAWIALYPKDYYSHWIRPVLNGVPQ